MKKDADPKERLSILVSDYMNSLVASYTRLLDSDLTAPQYLILQMLAGHEKLNCSELAASLSVTLPAVTNLSNKLVRKGLAERIPSEADRRSVYLIITDAGRAVYSDLLQKYIEVTNKVWSDFSEEELNLLIRTYEKMTERMQQELQQK